MATMTLTSLNNFKFYENERLRNDVKEKEKYKKQQPFIGVPNKNLPGGCISNNEDLKLFYQGYGYRGTNNLKNINTIHVREGENESEYASFNKLNLTPKKEHPRPVYEYKIYKKVLPKDQQKDQQKKEAFDKTPLKISY